MGKTTLVIMAAGIGSRFGGGIKQLTSFGPSGEIIMDYSIYDAIQAGFDRIVFVIRRDLEEDFKKIIGERIAKHIPVDYAYQELEDLPEGYALPAGRTKPWGTGQAILACKDIVKEPFAVINADDYYGKDAFVKIHGYLQNRPEKGEKMPIGMAGFVLKNTLSEHGGVTRGICSLSEIGELTGVSETKNIIKTPEGAVTERADGSRIALDPESLVSMNFWGYFPEFFEVLDQGFRRFLRELPEDKLLTGEYLLPTIVDGMIQNNTAAVSVLQTEDKWFGVTYKEDVPIVIQAIRELIDRGDYPESLL